MISGKVEIPDLNYWFPRDTVNSVKMVQMGIRYLFPITASVVYDCEKFCKCETCNRAICANHRIATNCFSVEKDGSTKEVLIVEHLFRHLFRF